MLKQKRVRNSLAAKERLKYITSQCWLSKLPDLYCWHALRDRDRDRNDQDRRGRNWDRYGSYGGSLSSFGERL